MSLPKLTGSKGLVEKTIRDLIAAKFTLLGGAVVHTRERYTDSFAEYIRKFSFKDPDTNKTNVRGVMIKFIGFRPMPEDFTCGCTPIRLRYECEVIWGFEDQRPDGGNSADDFNAFLLNAFDAFDNDDQLGFANVFHYDLSAEDDLKVLPFDTVLCHSGNLNLEVEVTC